MEKDRRDALKELARTYLEETGGGSIERELGSGGSAAVFQVKRPDGVIVALKVYDPQFFEGQAGQAELHRLKLQERFIGHKCSHLVQVLRVNQGSDTAFIEMEYLDVPDLKEVLGQVPDDKVVPLIRQLVTAVRFIESFGLVHRDIKPENIKVTPDFGQLTLLDLGVIREIDLLAKDESPEMTDYGLRRPFLATAQYSSPEYLFRLKEPTERLWKALSIYQVGAVLYDLIRKKPIYSEEVATENKYVLAHAVLTKTPTFDDDPKRFSQLKAIALSSLVKDMDVRLSLVDWQTFDDLDTDAIETLRSMLRKRKQGAQLSLAERGRRIEFERAATVDTLKQRVRARVIELCAPELPTTVAEWPGQNGFNVTCRVEDAVYIVFGFSFAWRDEIDDSRAVVGVCACVKSSAGAPEGDVHPIGECSVKGDNSQPIDAAVSAIAAGLTRALEIQAAGRLSELIGETIECGRVE